MRVGVPIVDYVTGYNALTGVLLALAARQRSGAGQRVEVTLFDTALSLLVPHAANWLCSGRTPRTARQRPSQHRALRQVRGRRRRDIPRHRQRRPVPPLLPAGGARSTCSTIRASRPMPRGLQHVAALRAEIERTLAAFKVRGSLPRADAGRRARGRGQHGAASLRPAARRPPRHAGRQRRPPCARHSREACETPGSAGRRPPHFGEHASEIWRSRPRSGGDRRLDRSRHRHAATERKRPTIRSPSRRRSKRSSGEETTC